MASSPLQLLYAQPPDGDPAHARVDVEPFSVGLGGSTRPREVIDGQGTRFKAISLGAQDLVELARELRRRANWYPVEVDIRDQTYQEPEDAREIEEALLGSLRAGQEDRALGYLTGPAEGVLFWAIGLTSTGMAGSVLISRDGTLRISFHDADRGIVDLVLQALLSVLSDEG